MSQPSVDLLQMLQRFCRCMQSRLVLVGCLEQLLARCVPQEILQPARVLVFREDTVGPL